MNTNAALRMLDDCIKGEKAPIDPYDEEGRKLLASMIVEAWDEGYMEGRRDEAAEQEGRT